MLAYRSQTRQFAALFLIVCTETYGQTQVPVVPTYCPLTLDFNFFVLQYKKQNSGTLRTLTSVTPEECGIQCLSTPYCVAFNYNSESLKCDMKNVATPTATIHQNIAWTYYRRESLSNCTSTTTGPPTTANIGNPVAQNGSPTASSVETTNEPGKTTATSATNTTDSAESYEECYMLEDGQQCCDTYELSKSGKKGKKKKGACYERGKKKSKSGKKFLGRFGLSSKSGRVGTLIGASCMFIVGIVVLSVRRRRPHTREPFTDTELVDSDESNIADYDDYTPLTKDFDQVY